MTVVDQPLPSFDNTFDNSFVRDLEGLYEPWQATPASAPEVVVLNEEHAAELGFDATTLRTQQGAATLVGNTLLAGSEPVAQAYAGHQFGGFSPRLGDGRALLLGEVIDRRGQRRDLHLKGSGRTPFARGGDGKATIGPMLREYLMGEAMWALGVPTTRSLAVVATGDAVARETMLPGAVLVRTASSHLRVGSFQYAANQDDPTLLRRLVDHAIARHQPDAVDAEQPELAFFEGVILRQAHLIARWMSIGFIHGVMNTDNMTISGETIDYGPCAFMDLYDPATVYSSIDQGGRYAYGNQPQIAQWNLARLAETMLPMFHDDIDAAVEIATQRLQTFPEMYLAIFRRAMLAKLGLLVDVDIATIDDGDIELIDDLLALLASQHIDWTNVFRGLARSLRGDDDPARNLFVDTGTFDAWEQRWRDRLDTAGRDVADVASHMDAVNPLYIPRNHLVEEVLAAGVDGDLGPFRQLNEVLADPFVERPGLERFAQPAPDSFGSYQTFCGT